MAIMTEVKQHSSTTTPETLSKLEEIQSLYFLPETPDIIPLEEGQRLVAIGDIHGKSKQLHKLLKAGGLIDSDLNWCGGNAICVQVGDIMDRGSGEDEILMFLCKLARQAKEAGGAVILLWGNHEAMMAFGNFICTTDRNAFEEQFGPIFDELKGENWREKYGTEYQARWAAMEPGGLLADPLLSKLKVVVQVGKSVLVHGGITKDYLAANGGISGINRKAREWISTQISASNGKERARIINRAFPAESPCWMRDYSSPPDEPGDDAVETKVNSALKVLEVDRIVVGHTIQQQINSIFDGKVWRIDIGDGIQAEDPSMIRLEALEVESVADQKEQVSILQHVELSNQKDDFFFHVCYPGETCYHARKEPVQ